MKIIKQEYLIKAPIEAVWQALIDPKIISKWGGGPVKMNDKVGEKFELWGGDIYGTNTKVIKNKKLEQDWYSDNWEKPSQVVFSLTRNNKGTKLELIHKNVPEKDLSDISDGWKTYYLGPLKELLELVMT